MTGGSRRPGRRAGAATRPDHRDRELRGRRYAIPFDRVWEGTLRLLLDGAPRWTVRHADDQAGVIRAEATTLLFRFVDDVEIRIGLDMDAQTRVDVTSRSRVGRIDFGTNRRRIRRFLRTLDRSLDARPELVLPPEGGSPAALSE